MDKTISFKTVLVLGLEKEKVEPIGKEKQQKSLLYNTTHRNTAEWIHITGHTQCFERRFYRYTHTDRRFAESAFTNYVVGLFSFYTMDKTQIMIR